jgi:transcriptional regulator with XRE-family HTH domain
MMMGDRLRKLREERKLTQADIGNSTGLTRFYISRLEHGHAVPYLFTLEKIARALHVPLYELFYEEGETPNPPVPLKLQQSSESLWGGRGKSVKQLARLRRALSKLDSADLRRLMQLARKMAPR